MTTSDFMSAVDVADRLGVSHMTVRRWATSRADFPNPIKFTARAHLFKRAEIEAYAASLEAA